MRRLALVFGLLFFVPCSAFAEPGTNTDQLRAIAEQTAPWVRQLLGPQTTLDLSSLDVAVVSRKEFRAVARERARELGARPKGLWSKMTGAMVGWAYSFGVGGAFVPRARGNDQLLFVKESLAHLSPAQIGQLVSHELTHVAQRQTHRTWFDAWTDGAARAYRDAPSRTAKRAAWRDLLAGRIAIEGQARQVEERVGNALGAKKVRMPLGAKLISTLSMLSPKALQMGATYSVGQAADPALLAAAIGSQHVQRDRIVPVAGRVQKELTPWRLLKKGVSGLGRAVRSTFRRARGPR